MNTCVNLITQAIAVYKVEQGTWDGPWPRHDGTEEKYPPPQDLPRLIMLPKLSQMHDILVIFSAHGNTHTDEAEERAKASTNKRNQMGDMHTIGWS